ncbi:MAG: RICIN domain-containing protein [Ktedonobacteraceae bacterium]|nr:RICIN domain-containing protein [Ktedonobacteraceae bacterium]MBO0792699.1 RICIN domain-containing protein [Ktedonobacteraceae bacterium]
MIESQKQPERRRTTTHALLIVLLAILLASGASLSSQSKRAHADSTFLGCTGDTSLPASSYPMFEVNVITPVCGSTISGTTTVTFVAPGMLNVWASIWQKPDATHTDPNGWDDRFQRVTPDVTGNAPSTITFDANTFPHGPIVIDLSAWDSPDGDPNFTHSDQYRLQLYNQSGSSWNEGIPAPPPQAAGMTAVYQDDFNGPLSISPTGNGTTYASLKPDNYPNGSQFGDAIMADPTDAYNPFTIMDNQYLRIRAAKAPASMTQADPFGRIYASGMLSAGHVDGTALGSVSDGYYEARMMVPAELGTWPAFWHLSQDSIGPSPLTTSSELDTMEGFGQFPNSFCQTWHYWTDSPTSNTNCNVSYTTDPGDFGDNNMSTWHTYGLKVTPTTMTWYVDNHETWSAPASPQSQDPLFFMINLELGSGWPIDLSRYNNQADMFVDWVRVFAPTGSLGTYKLVNRNSGQTLDVQGSSTTQGAALVQEPANGASSQSWQYKPDGGGLYSLLNQNSGFAAAISGASTNPGTPVIQWTDNGGWNGEWQLAPVGDGYYKIVSGWENRAQVMDVDGGSTTAGAAIVENTWNGSASQEWQLVQVS